MIDSMRGVPAIVTLALACAAGGASAQGAGGFDLSALDIPPGFLDLTDVILATGSHGDLLATGTTVLGNAQADLLLAVDPSAGLRDGMTLAIKPEAWKLTEAIPALSNPILDEIDFSNVTLVLAGAEREMYSNELTDEEWYFYRDVYGTDEFVLTLRPGVNLIAALAAEDLGPDHPMNIVMNALGIEKGTILLQGGLGQSLGLLGGGGGAASGSAVRDMFIRAELPPMRPPGSPEWFLGGQLALELTGDPMVRFVGELSIEIDDDVLDFFVATSLARTGMALTGGLLAEDGWEQPFGIQWLIFRGVVLQMAITPTGSIQPGFAASMVIGEKDIDVAVALAISPAGVPTNLMFTGASEAGVALADLVELQQRMAAARQVAIEAAGAAAAPPAIPVEALPDVAFRSLELGFASKDAPELGIERGFKLGGRLWLPLSSDGELTDFAGVDVDVSEQGIIARGDLGAFELGPLVWNDAALDLTATREAQHLMVNGEVEMFGARQLVDLSISRESLSFRSETNMFDMFTADITARSELDLRRPDFQVDAVAHADFGDAVGPMTQEAIVQFAAGGEDVIAAAAQASDAAAGALANAEATAEELYRVLAAQRQQAADGLAAAELAAAAASRSMRSALGVRNRALRAYYATPRFPAWRKARALVSYRRAHAVYRVRAVVYNAAAATVAVRRGVLAAIPPADQSILMLGARQAISELRSRLQTMQDRLDTMESQLAAIREAVERGEQLLVIERAAFHGSLQGAMNGQAMQWDITGRFVGEAFEVHETMDFSDPGAGAGALIQELIGR